jgi:uncharacterized protein involved in exopolysaccharide biosynthesis
MRNQLSTHTLVFSLLLLFFCVGCTGNVTPEPSIETARLAIAEANRNEAAQYAPSEIGKAQQKLNLAEQEQKKHNVMVAKRLGEQATVDARYAQVRAQAEKAKSLAIETQDTKETIQGVR